jgi:RimJ/RimL family protein N-acetyltransferase
MQVRVLGIDDATAFQAIRLRGLQQYPSAFASSYEEESSTPVAVVAERLAAKEDSAIFGAFEGEQLVGVVGLQREQMRKLAHKAFIWGMFVEPSVRKRGVGQQLVTHALSFAGKTLHVRQVNLGVNANNIAAIALYKSLGFEQFGFERGFLLVAGELHDEIQMVRVLQTEA